MPRAFNAEQVCSGFALTPTMTGRDECAGRFSRFSSRR
jgi:hypothetical protein